MNALAERHGINRKTVAKWRKRRTVEDAPMGPKQPRSTVLTPYEFVCAEWQKSLERFVRDPTHETLGLNT